MAQRFIACDREQSFLMPPDVREWLPEGHFAWFVLGVVESMELDGFYAVSGGRAQSAGVRSGDDGVEDARIA